jgi:hypothetical protein
MIKAEKREKVKEKRDFWSFLSSFLFNLFSKIGKLESNNLNKTTNPLISLIILLIISVDKPVDKLWISCGWSCG